MKPSPQEARDHRRAMEDVFFHRAASAIPASIRLDLWHRHAVAHGLVCEEIAGMRAEEVETHLGFARAARYRAFPRLLFASAEVHECREGDDDVTEYAFPGGRLTKRVRRTQAMIDDGMAGHCIEYPLKTAGDYELFLGHMPNASLAVALEGFADFDGATGGAGLPLLIVGSCPAHRLMLELTGYEAFYLQSADFPQLVDGVIRAMERLYRERLWPLLERSAARLILHGNHFSSGMTPPPVFEKYFLPYFADFNDRMHRAGKKVLWHADAEMGALLNHVVRAGFDGADCLATRPLVPQDIQDYIRAWQGRIVMWGGLPSVIFDPSYPFDDFKTHVGELVSVTRGRVDFIFGASDNVLPGAEWRRLRFLADSIGG